MSISAPLAATIGFRDLAHAHFVASSSSSTRLRITRFLIPGFLERWAWGWHARPRAGREHESITLWTGTSTALFLDGDQDRPPTMEGRRRPRQSMIKRQTVAMASKLSQTSSRAPPDPRARGIRWSKSCMRGLTIDPHGGGDKSFDLIKPITWPPL